MIRWYAATNAEFTSNRVELTDAYNVIITDSHGDLVMIPTSNLPEVISALQALQDRVNKPG